MQRMQGAANRALHPQSQGLPAVGTVPPVVVLLRASFGLFGPREAGSVTTQADGFRTRALTLGRAPADGARAEAPALLALAIPAVCHGGTPLRRDGARVLTRS